jgi:flavin-dependent dehydrogenase
VGRALSARLPGTQVDVLIVGGGLAGCASALTLRRAGRSVIVVNKPARRMPRYGEILPPHAMPELARLGVLERFRQQAHMPSYLVHCAWGQDGLYQTDLTFHPYGPNWHLDRVMFDGMLLSAAENEGAYVVTGSVISLTHQSGNGWEIVLAGSAGEHRLTAPFVIDATGRASSVARRLGYLRRSYDQLAGLVAFLYIGAQTQVAEVVTVIEAAPDGWWYAGRLPGRRIVAAFMTDPDLLPSGRSLLSAAWRDHLESTAHISRMWRNAASQSPPRVARANTSRVEEFVGDGWLAVGDAAMAFDPLSSQGICRALESGGKGGEVAHRCLAGDRNALEAYAIELEGIFLDYLQQRTYYYGREHRWVTSPFWRRRRETAQVMA